MNGNLVTIDGYPVTPKAILNGLVPPEIVKQVAKNPSLSGIKEATVRMARARQAKEIKQSHKVIRNTRQTEWKSVNGLGEQVARGIPFRALIAHSRQCGYERPDSPENVEHFLKDNPQYRVKITRGTRGQEIRKY